ncbi:hypothetical protein [uncultured Sphingomonas sp.]|jgi:hypothetical protein|uniref:hypothetical protein n=1 Tax=uncultured Sphingomonas sp. TaxID=158754 RepID=UPI00258E742A|nr:hypothetical protein [uncultured Sphingomonas sp.]
MFTVTDNYTFTRPVKVLVPANGGHDPQEFKATFRVIPVDQQDGYDLGDSQGSSDFLCAIIVELSDLVDGAGQALPYSDALRDRLLRFQFIRVALTTAYFDAIKKAVAGN